MLIAEEGKESARKIERFGRNCISVEIPPLGRTTRFRRNVSQIWTILIFFDKLKSCLMVFTSVLNFVKCHANHVNRARALIGWQIPTHVCQSFTRQIRVYQRGKVGEKVGENRSKFYLSPTVCQRVCRLFLCRSHTPTWVCQHAFANFSLPCEGRLALI